MEKLVVRGEYGTSESEQLKLGLTSCCGIVLSPKNRKIVGAAHALIPGRSKLGVEYLTNSLLRDLLGKGVDGRTLEAYLFGCAKTNLLGIVNIGEKNAVEARRILNLYGIPVLQDLTEGYESTNIFASPDKIAVSAFDYDAQRKHFEIALK